jgi:hypothetical protein
LVFCSKPAPGKNTTPPPSFLRALPGGKPTCPSCHGTACPECAAVTEQYVPSDCHGTACSEYAAVTGQHVPSTRLSRYSMFRVLMAVTGQHVLSTWLSRDRMFRVRGCHGTACPEYAAVTGQNVPGTRLSRDSMSRVRGCHGTACS